MNITGVFTFVYQLIDYVINNPMVSIETITILNNIVTGTNFITNNVIKPNGYIKLTIHNNTYFAKVKTIDSETQLTLYNNYEGGNGTGAGVYLTNYYIIFYSNQNSPGVKLPYIIIDRPAVSQNKIGYGDYDDRVELNKLRYTIYYNIVIAIRQVGGYAELLQKLINTYRNQDVLSFYQGKQISLMSFGNIIDVSREIGTQVETENILELNFNYVEDLSIDSNYINTVIIDRV